VTSIILAMLVTSAAAQDRGRGAPAEPPTIQGKVTAYAPDQTITVGTRARGGAVLETAFSIVKDKTQVVLEGDLKAIEVGTSVSVWADKDSPKNAARIIARPEPPAARGKVTAYEPDTSIKIQSAARGGAVRETEFSIAKDKTRIEGKVEVGATVSVWADKENPTTAARIAAQGAAPAPRNRGAGNPEGSKPAAPPPAAPKAEGPADANAVLEAYKANLPTTQQLEWYTLDWVNSLTEARERAARENRPILFIQTNKEGDLFCSLC